MKIEDFLYVTTIAEMKSFTLAANKLFVTQPTLSQRVKYIEQKYKTQLFSRDSKGAHLTKAGELFVEYAKRILDTEQELRKLLYTDTSTHNQLSLGIPQQILLTPYIDTLLHTFVKQIPEVRMTIYDEYSSTLQELLLSGEIEIAVCYLPITSDQLDYITIHKDRFVLVPAKGGNLDKTLKNNSMAGGSTISFKMLENEPIACSIEGAKTSSLLAALSKKHHISLNITHHCRNLTTLRSIAENGIASTLILESMFENSSFETPYYYLDDTEECALSIALVWKKKRDLNKMAKNFLSVAQKQV